MMLTIFGLPASTKYHDLKVLVKQQCHLNDFILDNLAGDTDGTKKVRIGVTDDREGATLIKCLDGFRTGGHVLKVTPMGKTVGQQGGYPQRDNYPPTGTNYNQQSSAMQQQNSWSTSNQWIPDQSVINQPAQSGAYNYQPSQGMNQPYYGQQHATMQRTDVRPTGQQGQVPPRIPPQDQNRYGYQPKPEPPRRAPDTRSHVLRSVEIIDEPLTRPMAQPNRYPHSQGFDMPVKPVTIMKDNFQGPSQYNLDRQTNQGIDRTGPAYQQPQSHQSHGQTTPWSHMSAEKPQSFSKAYAKPDPGTKFLPRSDMQKEGPGPRFSPRRDIPKDSPRFSPRRDIHKDGPRFSPRREIHKDSPRFSPRRDIQKDGPRFSPRRDMQNSPKDVPRFSPRRDMQKSGPRFSPRRDIPKDGLRFSPRREIQKDGPIFSPRRELPKGGPRFSPRREMYKGESRYSPRREIPKEVPRFSPRRDIPRDGPRFSPRRDIPGDDRRFSPRREGQRFSPRRDITKDGPGPRFSPRRDMPQSKKDDPVGRRLVSPGRRISPGMRMSPGRGISPPGRRSPPAERHMHGRRSPSPAPKRMSPGRRSPARRDSPSRTMRYSPSRRMEKTIDKYGPPDTSRPDGKGVRPAYEPGSHAPNQALYSGGYRPNIHENVQYPVPGVRPQEQRPVSWQQDRDKHAFSSTKTDNARDVSKMPKFEPRIMGSGSPIRKSRSPVRTERPALRDRYKKHSPSPRSPRRSWALEKRRSPDIRDAPPPPVWPGQSQGPREDRDDQYRKRHNFQEREEDVKRVAVWDRPSFDEKNVRRPPERRPEHEERNFSANNLLRVRTDLQISSQRAPDDIPERRSDYHRQGGDQKPYDQSNFRDTYKPIERGDHRQESPPNRSRREEFPRREGEKNVPKHQDEFQKEIDDVCKRAVEFKKRAEELRRSDERRKQDYTAGPRLDRDNSKDDRSKFHQKEDIRREESHGRDNFRERDESHQEYHHPDERQRRDDASHRRQKEVSEPLRAPPRRTFLSDEAKAKWEKAVEEISEKILKRNIEEISDDAILQRIRDELKITIHRALREMFGPMDVAFIEMIIKFSAKYDNKAQRKIFDEVMSRFPRNYRTMKRPAEETARPADIPPKVARHSSEHHNVQGYRRDSRLMRRIPERYIDKRAAPFKSVQKKPEAKKLQAKILEARKFEAKKPEAKQLEVKNPVAKEPVVNKLEVKKLLSSSKKLSIEEKTMDAESNDVPSKIKQSDLSVMTPEGLVELKPLMSKMLEAELQDIMIKVWQELPDKPTSDVEELVANKFRNETGDAFRNIMGLNVTKRLLSMHNRFGFKMVFSKKPIVADLKRFMTLYNCHSLKRIPHEDFTYIVQCRTLANYEKLYKAKLTRMGSAKMNFTPCYNFGQCPPKLKTIYNMNPVKTDDNDPKNKLEITETNMSTRKDEENSDTDKIVEAKKTVLKNVSIVKKDSINNLENKKAAEVNATENKTNLPNKIEENASKVNTKLETATKTMDTKPMEVDSEVGCASKVQANEVTPKTSFEVPKVATKITENIANITKIKTNEAVAKVPPTANKANDKSTANTKIISVAKATPEKAKVQPVKTNTISKSIINKSVITSNKKSNVNQKSKDILKRETKTFKDYEDIDVIGDVEYDDDDILDDKDILALMSEAIILDECSGSDEE